MIVVAAMLRVLRDSMATVLVNFVAPVHRDLGGWDRQTRRGHVFSRHARRRR